MNSFCLSETTTTNIIEFFSNTWTSLKNPLWFNKLQTIQSLISFLQSNLWSRFSISFFTSFNPLLSVFRFSFDFVMMMSILLSIIFIIISIIIIQTLISVLLWFSTFFFFVVLVTIDNKPCQLQLCDTAGQVSFFFLIRYLFFSQFSLVCFVWFVWSRLQGCRFSIRFEPERKKEQPRKIRIILTYLFFCNLVSHQSIHSFTSLSLSR